MRRDTSNRPRHYRGPRVYHWQIGEDAICAACNTHMCANRSVFVGVIKVQWRRCPKCGATRKVVTRCR